MRFEKLGENKIRITLTHDDLRKKDIDFHSFMTDSIETQDLFYDCLKRAEKEIGFVTKDYRLRIEALAMSSGDFVLIVTRTLPERNNRKKRNLHIKKEKSSLTTTQAVCCFSSFDNYFSFISFFKHNNFKPTNIADYIFLFEYKHKYYLIFNNINLSYPNLKKLLYGITEFGYFLENPNFIIGKIFENGTLIMKHNAIKTSIIKFP